MIHLQFYVHPKTGLRMQSKQDVLLYANDGKISKCDTNGQCNTSSEDNVCLLPEPFTR